MAYYAIPDIHGNYDGLLIAIDLVMQTFNKDEDTLIFLGDYVDRGPKSFEVLTYLKELQEKLGSDKVVCLIGNHDQMLNSWAHYHHSIKALENDKTLSTVKSFLGDSYSSHEIYLSDDYKILSKLTGADLSGEISNKILSENEELFKWLESLPLYHDLIEEENILFVHAGIEEEVLGETWKTWTSKQDFTWKYPASRGKNPYGFNIVAGHVNVHKLWMFKDEPCFEIMKSGHHIYVDGGSPWNPILNVLKIENGEFFDLVHNQKL